MDACSGSTIPAFSSHITLCFIVYDEMEWWSFIVSSLWYPSRQSLVIPGFCPSACRSLATTMKHLFFFYYYS
jgi:hypothetical protein